MIVISGATGKLGSQIVERLLEAVPPGEVGVSVRDPDRAAGLASLGVRVRRGDFSDPATLRSAFEGAERVLIVSVGKLGDEAVAAARAAIDAAYLAGAERVLYTSHQAANPASLFRPAVDHAAVEAHLESTGRPWTSLRNGFYTSSLEYRLGDARRTGELIGPAGGAVSWTSRRDLAEAAAAILAVSATWDGPTPPLTAAQAVDMDQVAAALADLWDRPVRWVEVDDDQWLAAQVRSGLPESLARTFLGTYHAAQQGEFDVTDPALATLIGRAPQSVGEALRSPS